MCMYIYHVYRSPGLLWQCLATALYCIVAGESPPFCSLALLTPSKPSPTKSLCSVPAFPLIPSESAGLNQCLLNLLEFNWPYFRLTEKLI